MNSQLRRSFCFLLVGFAVSGSMLECVGSTAALSHDHLSRVWQEEFSLPSGDSRPTISKSQVPAQNSAQYLPTNQPHPAVVRVVVPEAGATSYGSGTLIDVRDQYGLVITNWHVVRDAQGMVEVEFPGGFKSKARALKVDPDWDLAALVIWRPSVEPVSIASDAPQPGDELTICGYGQGTYRSATGRCTQYYAPRLDFPQHMVELDVEARQGDSGGPIFNSRGEMAGVLFGAGQGTTLGSFGGRVDCFLASLAPDIGQRDGNLVAQDTNPPGCSEPLVPRQAESASSVNDELQHTAAADSTNEQLDDLWQSPAQETENLAAMWPKDPNEESQEPEQEPQPQANAEDVQWRAIARNGSFEQMKNVLAAIGLVSLAVLILRAAR